MEVFVVDATQHSKSERVHGDRRVLQEIKEGELGAVRPLSRLEDFLAMVILFAIAPGSLAWLPLFILFLTFYFGLTYGATFVLTTIVVTIVTVDMHRPKWPPRWFKSWISDLMFRYFSVKIVYTQPWDTKRKHLVAGVPHGVFPGANILWVWAYRRFFDSRPMGGMAASACFRIPIYAHIFAAISAMEASEHAALQMLHHNKSVGVSPGGIAEIFACTEENEHIVLGSRHGFIRIALETGTNIVPIYCFGQTHLMSSFSDRWGILESISRRLRTVISVMWGRFFLPIPRRVPILIAIGEPLEMPKIEKPTQDQLEEHHARFVEQVRRLFEMYKCKYGWANKKLFIE